MRERIHHQPDAGTDDECEDSKDRENDPAEHHPNDRARGAARSRPTLAGSDQRSFALINHEVRHEREARSDDQRRDEPRECPGDQAKLHTRWQRKKSPFNLRECLNVCGDHPQNHHRSERDHERDRGERHQQSLHKARHRGIEQPTSVRRKDVADRCGVAPHRTQAQVLPPNRERGADEEVRDPVGQCTGGGGVGLPEVGEHARDCPRHRNVGGKGQEPTGDEDEEPPADCAEGTQIH